MNTTATTGPTTSKAPVRKRHLVRAAAALLAVAGLGFATSAPSQAYTSTRTNVPVMPTVYAVQGSHYDTGTAVTGPMWRQWVFQSGPVVQRTVTSGAQTVQVTYTVTRWNGSAWARVTTQSGSATIAAGRVSAKLPNLSILPNAGSGYYNVALSIVWTSPIGGVQSSDRVAMNQSGDYTCTTTRPCTAGAGWVYLG